MSQASQAPAATGLGFGDAEESGNSVFIKPGVHRVKVKEIYYQPVGPSVREEKIKDGSPREYKVEQMMLTVEVLDTVAGNNSKGAITNVGILNPVFTGDPTKTQKKMNRIFHIFVNMAKDSSSKEKAREYLKALTINETRVVAHLSELLKGFEGRELHLLFCADQEGKYTNLSQFEGGIASTVDMPHAISYDESKYGLRKKASVELAKDDTETAVTDTGAGVNLAPEDDLPF